MSGYKEHYTVAATCGVLLSLALYCAGHLDRLISLEIFLCIVASTLGGLFPDIDIKSKGQQLLYALLIPCFAAALLAQHIVLTLLLGALGVLSPLLPHRGITHEAWFVVAAPLIGPLLASMYCPDYSEIAFLLYIFFVVGALSHLVLDFGFIQLIQRTIRGFSLKKQVKTRRR